MPCRYMSVSHGQDEQGKFVQVSIDRSGLTNPNPKAEQNIPIANRYELLPLGRELAHRISFRGPLSIADWMRTCLLHPTDGYYAQSQEKIFGQKGDFITSPEICQIFGELIGVWCVAMWQSRLIASSSRVHLIEIGPGRGTLMKDMLRTFHKFPMFSGSLQVSMVETSTQLRLEQAQTLGCVKLEHLVPPEQTEESSRNQDQSPPMESAPNQQTIVKSKSVTANGIPVSWYSELGFVPVDDPDTFTLVVCHEFFDALPTHVFSKTEKGWAEHYVDVSKPSNAEHFCEVLVPSTPFAKILEERNILNPKAEIGTVVEYSPDAIQIVNLISTRVKANGAALIIDYGTESHRQHSTVRGISQHHFVNCFHQPGTVDLSVDVDFAQLGKEAAGVGCGVFGPMEQGSFLLNMGLEVRLNKLIANCSNTKAQQLVDACQRLVDDEDMGRVYKVMAITSDSSHAAVGFSEN
eukprot:c3734_g1_i1.p1 GENE.c3734_g1_i1~~c3734_g1_i1.p1  ORF type:complete len:495 (-),score=114.89 c3734_g1_i1:70-1461(-)